MAFESIQDKNRILSEVLRKLEETLAGTSDYLWPLELNGAPPRPRAGQIFFADGTNWNPGNGPGLYLYYGGGYIQITGVDTWDDLRFSFTSTRRGALAKPDFDYTNLGLLFPQNDSTEIVYMIGQMPHGYKPGTDIHPHSHWQQSQAGVATWKLDYKWYNNGDLVPAAFTTITTSSEAFTYTSGTLAQISSFPAIDGTGMKESSVLLMKFYRDDNVVSGDVLATEFDIHFQSNKSGTNPEYPA